MNQTDSLRPNAPPPAALEAIQTRFALRVAAALTERSRDAGADVTERLRFAREKALAHALERAQQRRLADATVRVGAGRAGVALLGQSHWWVRLASVLPVLALIAGLVVIQRWQDNAQISVAAEVDAALLADDLPPGAYGDAGFAEFLKTPGE